jgi:hypothetical protein
MEGSRESSCACRMAARPSNSAGVSKFHVTVSNGPLGSGVYGVTASKMTARVLVLVLVLPAVCQ